MHAAERYEGVVDKLRECSEHLEGTKEAARDLAVRFEEVKKHRQQLFQVLLNLTSTSSTNRCVLLCE